MVKYRQNIDEMKAQIDDLTPELLQFYNALLLCFREVDRSFPPPDDSFPPECLIPSMTYNDEPVDGRTICGIEVSYKKGLWHLVMYEERSNKVEEHNKYKKLDDLIYNLLCNFILMRAQDITLNNPDIKKKYDAAEEPNTFLNLHKCKLALQMMSAVKPKWEGRLKAEIDSKYQ